ncbi:LexA family transcriptional regulator [Dyella sp.]|uniref:LexA family transcriptional regulator n=1 Tax=Dyella sp. TaxID=1869338 RepID=UPI0028474672|nr:LexA family transcriptional regulator [Dyella sp.]MDR3444715.1 LexA family transcriptional regulator [Dyella sp.]
MNYLVSNLKFLIDRESMTENALANETGMDQSQINRIIAGKNKDPRDRTIQPLAERFNLSVRELKYVDLTTDPNAKAEGQQPGNTVRIFVAPEIPSAGAAKLHPLADVGYQDVSAAWLASVTDAPAAAVKIAYQPDDSMQGEIEKGDLVLIDTSVRKVLAEGIYALTYFGIPHIKRGLVVGKDSLRFTGTRSFNSIPVEGAELDGLEIIGKVFATLSPRRF